MSGFHRSGHNFSCELTLFAYILVMGDIDILLYDYYHEQISRLSRLLPTNENTKRIMNCPLNGKITLKMYKYFSDYHDYYMIIADYYYH